MQTTSYSGVRPPSEQLPSEVVESLLQNALTLNSAGSHFRLACNDAIATYTTLEEYLE